MDRDRKTNKINNDVVVIEDKSNLLKIKFWLLILFSFISKLIT